MSPPLLAKRAQRRNATQSPNPPQSAQVPAPLRRYTDGRAQWRAGNAIEVLRDGAQTFPAKLAAITAARYTICLEIYIFDDDFIGRRFINALCARASEGLVVRLLYDAVGSFGLPTAALQRMRDAGVEIVEFHPIAPWRQRWNLSHRDHRKILVVDDEIAFVGGLNLGKDYVAVSDGGGGWHDMHCSLRGPVVMDLSRLFRRNWINNGGSEYPAAPRAETIPADAGPSFARMIDNALRKRRRGIRRAYLDVIHASQRHVLIKNAYFLPERELRRAMERAIARGVEVAVIVPGSSDVRMVQWAGYYVHRRLSKAGVRVLCWPGAMMHAKTAVIDGIWSTIGSYNLDARSLRYNLEVTVEILDADVGGELARQFRMDEPSCEVFNEAAWQALPWWIRILSWIAFRFRRWL
jgi:cardiolipin synthase A/B